MKFMKQVISLCLVLALVCGFLPVGARAEETVAEETVAAETVAAETAAEDPLPDSQEQVVQGYSEELIRLINPNYAHLVTEEDIAPSPSPRAQTYANPVFVTSVDKAAEVLRQQMKDRVEEPVVYININRNSLDEDYVRSLAIEIFNTALEHTGVPNEGDYLRWLWLNIDASAKYEGVQGDIDLTLYYELSYITTAAEEASMDSRVASLLSELKLGGKSDYEKIKGIYDYICTHVAYADQDDIRMHSAYAALVKGTAGHLGFAPLVYRLALELGVDCRVISGDLVFDDGSVLSHLWNIVELDNLYYNADVLLDTLWYEDTMGDYQFFLCCPANFPGHSRADEFATSAFNEAYPMATKDYVPTHTHSYTAVVTKPTCTQKGYTTYTCSCGYSYTGNETAALGHTVVIDSAVAASCTKTGLTEGKHCSVCKAVLVKQETVSALGHSWNDGVVTKEPTESAPGVKTYTCTVCKATRTEEIVSCSVYRISGKDRVKTALSVANALLDCRRIDKFDAVIIATGVNEKFADALSGSYLANMKKAPILLYTNSGFSQLNVNFIKEKLKTNGTVYILGGTGAIPESVEKTLSAYNVKRLSGKTRYETNLAILKEAGVSGAKEILVATGTNFADSLSASATGLPLLLVNGKGTGLNAAQIEFLKSVSGKKITIIGGTGAVNEEMKEAIEAASGVTAERLSGKTRHNTSVLIAQKYFSNAEHALITYAKNFPDGLAGGPLAYAMGIYAKGAPLLLTNAGQESVVNEYLTAKGINKGFVLGGDSAVSDETARKTFGLPDGAEIERLYYTE